MSTTIDPSDDLESLGFPELTPLGKKIEVLRIGRGMSKQYLARYAGASRQQLWRVMTGKSELTAALRFRLAEALRVPESALLGEAADTTTTTVSTAPVVAAFGTADLGAGSRMPCEEYLRHAGQIERTLSSMPNGDDGRELKRALLNKLEDLALARNVVLSPEFFELRRRVLAGEL
jgi:transcriptional regulator with XRE-family HTH domain